MRPIALILAVAAGSVLLAGCTGSQSRKSRPDLGISDEVIQRERARHGGAGTEIAYLFNTGEIKDARQDTSGASHGLRGTEFYQVQIAPDPRQPSQLVKVGFARKVEEDRGSLFYYEFYDGMWNSIAKLMSGGELYSYSGRGETLLGRFDLTGAVTRVYPAPSGYGYDQVGQDQVRGRMSDPDIAGLDSRGRSVYHTPHSSAPPVVVFTLYRSGEAGLLANTWERSKFEEAESIRLERQREKRHGGIGQDETYGGLSYKQGNPVDADGKPLRPASTGGK